MEDQRTLNAKSCLAIPSWKKNGWVFNFTFAIYFWVMDYDEACFMHLTPGVVHNFPKAVGV